MEIKTDFVYVNFESKYNNQAMGFTTALIECAYLRFKEIDANFYLEGDENIWLACGLYEQYKESSERSALSLDRFLSVSRICITDFFNKMSNWMEMAASTPTFQEHVNGLKQTFNCSMALFRRYRVMFWDVFDSVNDGDLGSSMSYLSVDELFFIVWLLHIQIKASLDNIKDDLATSAQLLLCCLDFVACNVIQSGRTDLIKATVLDTLEVRDTTDTKLKNVTVPNFSNVLELLCLKHAGGQLTECHTVREHWFRPHIVKLASEGALTLDEENTVSLFSSKETYFANRNYLETSYELLIQKAGHFDERVFVRESVTGDSKTFDILPNFDDIAHNSSGFDKHLQDGDCELSGVVRLQALLFGCSNSPSRELLRIFEDCSPVTVSDVLQRVSELGDRFSKYSQLELKKKIESEHLNAIIDSQLFYVEALFFKLLYNLLTSELKRGKTSSPIACVQSILEKDIFHRSLFAICIEIVLFSYNSKSRLFPWVSDILDVRPYHFYRIIEVVIKQEGALTRDVIKHLNWVEESILEEYAWRNDSPLWIELEISQPETSSISSVPRCIDVLLPIQIATSHNQVSNSGLQKLPGYIEGSNATLKAMATQSGQGLVSTSVIHESVHNQLSSSAAVASSVARNTQSDQASLSSSSAKLELVCSGQVESPTKGTLHGHRSRAIALFFRKVYLLSSVRIREIVMRLEVDDSTATPKSDPRSNTGLKATIGNNMTSSGDDSNEMKKVWALFENCIVLSLELLVNRHLDQMILCSIYLVGKMLSKSWSFKKILSVYRLQAQARSDIYRSATIGYVQTSEHAFRESRADIVTFYNKVFLPNCGDYAQQLNSSVLSYSSSMTSSSLNDDAGSAAKKQCLDRANCVVPVHKEKPLAARKVASSHNVYLMPYREEDEKSGYERTSTLTYQISISPSKTLDDINSHIRSQELNRKRSQTTIRRDTHPSALKSAILSGSYKYNSSLIDSSNLRTGAEVVPAHIRRNPQTIRVGGSSNVVNSLTSTSNSDRTTHSFPSTIEQR